MATLTETAYHTRRAVNWTILAVILYIILRIVWSIFISVWLAIFPPKPPPPNYAFGKLSSITFPPTASPSAQLTFRLETVEGTVPKASESATVYFMPKSAANLLALTRTQQFAQRLGFATTPIQETKNIYRFEDPDAPLRSLRYDIVSNNFTLRYVFEQDIGLFNERNLPTNQAAIAEAKSMLQTYNLYVGDLVNGPSQVTYWRVSGNKLIPATSLSQGDAVRVDFFRRPIGETPILTPYPQEGQVSFILSGTASSKKRLLQFAYAYWPIDYQNTATYALKPSSQAWQELQSGGGYIARYPSGTTAIVRNVYLAYFDSLEAQTYLQPVFVFVGDEGFLAYIPAVVREWVE